MRKEKGRMGKVRVGDEYLTSLPSCRPHCCRSMPVYVIPHIQDGWHILWADVSAATCKSRFWQEWELQGLGSKHVSRELVEKTRVVVRKAGNARAWKLGSLCRINTNSYTVWDAKEKTCWKLARCRYLPWGKVQTSGQYNICYQLWVLKSNSVHMRTVYLKILWAISQKKKKKRERKKYFLIVLKILTRGILLN